MNPRSASHPRRPRAGRHTSSTRALLSALLLSLACLGSASSVRAATVWSGPTVTISKAPGETVVDVLTEQVHLTRGNTGGLFNARLESGFDHLGRTSPLDTEWAHGSTADDLASLDFTTWDVAFGGQFSNPGALIGVPMVVHLLSDDIYLDFTLTDWGGVATQGRFSYERSSPVPVPAALLLLAGALPLLVRGTRRRC